MAARKNFNFKHKIPTEIETANTKTNESHTDQQTIDDNIAGNRTANRKRKTILKKEDSIIKPKSEPRNKRVQLLLTESNYLKLKEYAFNGGTSVNDAVNQIIENL